MYDGVKAIPQKHFTMIVAREFQFQFQFYFLHMIFCRVDVFVGYSRQILKEETVKNCFRLNIIETTRLLMVKTSTDGTESVSTVKAPTEEEQVTASYSVSPWILSYGLK